MTAYRIVGINFDHMHMGDNLRMAFNHPDCEIVGVCDERPERMSEAVQNFAIPDDKVFTDYRRCMEETAPDFVLLCPATANHGLWTERIAPYGKAILMEKPFAASLAEADAMIAACEIATTPLAINWPLAWYPCHRKAKQLVDDGTIGQVKEVHFYDGNRGPLWHGADKATVSAEQVEREKPGSWFYRREAGGGSLLDYLGYGATLGAWFLNGRKPIEVTCTVDGPQGLEVDEHSVTVARYDTGLSKFETRWGTWTDPWDKQPQPKCGFVLVGTKGTLSSYDFEETVRVQDERTPAGRDVHVGRPASPFANPVQYMIHCIESGLSPSGPLSPEISRIGQQIVDTAYQSAIEKRTLPLID